MCQLSGQVHCCESRGRKFCGEKAEMSMESRELMIGDWVSYDGEYVKIEGVTTDSGRYKYPFSVEYIDGRDFAHIAVLNVEPIPLTEEMLINNGFEDLGRYFRLQDDILMIHRNGGKLWAIIGTWAIDIQYVHKLQHLLRFCGLNELAENFKIE